LFVYFFPVQAALQELEQEVRQLVQQQGQAGRFL